MIKPTTITLGAMLVALCASSPVSAQVPINSWSLTSQPLAKRVADDFPGLPNSTKFVHYDVPPMSSLQRLPDIYPEDGIPGGTVRIVAAKDEYEPGSFLIYARENLGKTQLSLTPFKSADGTLFPPEDLDLKFIKVWYQNRNAWYSYFGDTGFKLVPELLLNDEDLIRVDTAKQANYARLTEPDGKTSEFWINPPREMCKAFWDGYRGGDVFQPMRKNFDDAPVLRPVNLQKGEFRNFFLTAHVRKTTVAGLYKGAIKVGNYGEIPVTIKVLPFELPKPKCFFDDNLDFFVCSYTYNCFAMIMEQNGGDLDLAKKQFKATMENLVAHNQDMNWLRFSLCAESFECWKLMKEAGLRTDVGVGGVGAAPDSAGAKRNADAADRFYGHHNIYIGHGDEPSPKWVAAQRGLFKANQEAGFKFIIAGKDQIFRKAGYLYDWHNVAKSPEDSSTTSLWNMFGSSPHVAWYAAMHVGVENPDYNRRQNGMAAYLAGYSALCNYAHHYGSYNDDSEGYRPMVFCYGRFGGVIDTLQWEGFREGIDDIRYATLMVKLAREAAKSQILEARYAGNKALQFLASFKSDADNLDACRFEMINHIIVLKNLLGK